MSAVPESTLAPMVGKLQQLHALGAGDQEAVLALPHRVIKLRPQEYLVREGDKPHNFDRPISTSGEIERPRLDRPAARTRSSREGRREGTRTFSRKSACPLCARCIGSRAWVDGSVGKPAHKTRAGRCRPVPASTSLSLQLRSGSRFCRRPASARSPARNWCSGLRPRRTNGAPAGARRRDRRGCRRGRYGSNRQC